MPVCECAHGSSGHILIVIVLCCSLEYHSQMVSDAVKRVIKQGKVMCVLVVSMPVPSGCEWADTCHHNLNMSDNTNSMNTQRFFFSGKT